MNKARTRSSGHLLSRDDALFLSRNIVGLRNLSEILNRLLL